MGIFRKTPTPRVAAKTQQPLTASASPARPVDGKVVPYGSVRPLTAATRPIKIDDKAEVDRIKSRKAEDWQTLAWDYLDQIGELKYSAQLVGSVMSRVRLYPAGVTSDDMAPSALQEIDDLVPGLLEDAVDAMKLLSTADGGVSGLLRDAAVNIFVAGEFSLVRLPPQLGSGTQEAWKVKSVDELIPMDNQGSTWALKTVRSSSRTDLQELPRGTYMARVWRTHPRYSAEADSNFRSMLDLFDELLLLSRTARSTARSRLNAGLLYIPDEITVSGASDGLGSDVDPDELLDTVDDDIVEQLMESMTTPIEDEASASAVVPLILRGPSEFGDKIQHIKFERSFDAQLTQRADKVMDRILAGLDLPKDIITGLAGVRYSNSVAISDSLYTSHIEPLALFLCDSLTSAFLHPVLRSKGYTDEEIAKVVVWFGAEAVTTKPNKAEASLTLYNAHALSGAALRRYNGFSEADAPDPIESAQRAAIDRAPISEPLSEAMWRSLVPQMLDYVRQQTLASSPAPESPQVQDAIDGQPSPTMPEDTNPTPPPPGLIEP